MNIINRLYGIGLEGYSLDELELIIKGQHSVKIMTVAPGLIILSSKKIIKCVDNYYKSKESKAYPKTTNECYRVMKKLDLDLSNYDCAQCHMRCIELKKQGNILRK